MEPKLIRPDFASKNREPRDLLRDMAIQADVAGGTVKVTAKDLHDLANIKAYDYGAEKE